MLCLIVASASPRRKQLLTQIVHKSTKETNKKGFTDIETVPSEFEENFDKISLGPFEYAIQTGTIHIFLDINNSNSKSP